MKSVELFAGAGGLALGSAAAGFKHVALIDFNRNACDTICHNIQRRVKHTRTWQLVEGDVRDYDFRPHRGEVDVVMGGPPCQPFSIGGKHLGMADPRDMIPEAVRAVRAIQPKAFLIENVKGLSRPAFANYFSYVLHQFRWPTVTRRPGEPWEEHLRRLEERETSGRRAHSRYNVVHRVLNAANYGVPQRRERIFIVGVRADLGVEFSFPEPSHTEDALLHDQWVTGAYWRRHGIDPPDPSDRLRKRLERLSAIPRKMLGQPWVTVRDAIGDLPQIAQGETCCEFPNHYLNPGARAYKGHDGSGWDWPSKVLKAGDHGVPGGENTLKLNDGTIRYYSVRECARLQTCPDDWELRGSWTECMRQLGNAVPVLLARVVAKKLHATLLAADLRRPLSEQKSH